MSVTDALQTTTHRASSRPTSCSICYPFDGFVAIIRHTSLSRPRSRTTQSSSHTLCHNCPSHPCSRIIKRVIFHSSYRPAHNLVHRIVCISDTHPHTSSPTHAVSTRQAHRKTKQTRSSDISQTPTLRHMQAGTHTDTIAHSHAFILLRCTVHNVDIVFAQIRCRSRGDLLK